MAGSLDDVKSALFWRAVLAELLGTGVLVLVGCGSCLGWEDGYKPTTVQISLCFGLIVATVVWGIGHISGGHVNPAVTVAMLLTRKISVARGVLFIMAQCVGAILGALVLKGLTPSDYHGSLGITIPHKGLSPQQAFGVEFMVTYVLVFTVCAACDPKRSDLGGSKPLAIGLSVTVCHLFAIKFTGSSMNSARSFGPAVVSGIWKDHWVYWCGPLLGGVVAALLYENLFAANASISKARGYLLASNYNAEDFDENPEKQIQLETDETV